MKNSRFCWSAIVVVIAISALLFNALSTVDEPAVHLDALATSPAIQNQSTSSVATAVGVTTEVNTDTSVPPQSTRELQDYTQIEARLEAMRQRRPERNFDVVAVEAAMKRDTAWSPAVEVPNDLPLEPEELTDGRQFIQLDGLKIETLMPGDNVRVSIDETGQEYLVSMDRVEKHDYDSISWHGHIDGADGQTYSVSFTRGKQLTVGGLDTPDGHYVLQAQGNNGWIASSDLLFKVDPNVDDAIYPHEEGHVH